MQQRRILAVAVLLLAAAWAAADTLTVTGAVTDPDQNPLVGAAVTVTLTPPGGGTPVVGNGTTNASGDYSITVDNAAGIRNAAIAVSATGYVPGNANARIGNPNDGVADTVVRDFQLQPIVMDTTTVTGLVLDSASRAPIAGARVILAYLAGEVDTVLTNASGVIQYVLVTQLPVAAVGWTVEADGHMSASGNALSVAGVVALDTVALAAYSAADTLAYTVSGNVRDDGGAGVRDAEVVLTVSSGVTVLATDTVQSAGGQGVYNAGVTLPYQAGNLTFTVSVTVAGFEPFTQAVTAPSSTTDLVIQVVLVPVAGVVPRVAGARSIAAGATVAHTLDGRVVSGGVSRAGSPQMLLRRWTVNAAVAADMAGVKR